MEKSFSLFREIVVDNFAGGGGASTGISLAIGRSVDVAINHDPAAISMHKVNHPDTEHYCESVWDIDPRTVTGGRLVALCWFSPDCKHFSKAKGGKPVEKGIRGLAWIALRWAAVAKPRVIMLENVEEFVTWGPLIAKTDPETGRMLKIIRSEDVDVDNKIVVAEEGEVVPFDQRYIIPDPKKKGRTFKSFINALKRQGYHVDWRELKACDYGAPTIRKRFFLIARRDNIPIIWPKATHGDPKSAEVKSGKLKSWRITAEIIDWSIPCRSIFERKKPLAENTMRRIARGIKRFVIDSPDPFIIKVNHQGDVFRGQSIDDPLQTITAKNGWGIVAPCIARIGQTGFGGDRLQYDIQNPLTTVTTKAENLLVAPTLIQYHGEQSGHEVRGQALDKPLMVVDASPRYVLVASFLAKHYGGGYTGPGASLNNPAPTITTVDHNALVTSHMIKFKGDNIGHPVTEPVQTITAGGLHFGEVRAFLLKYYGTGEGQSLNEPMHTVTTKDRFGLVTIHGQDYQIIDIGMRMLEPHELFAAQGFPKDYIIDRDCDGKKYSKSAQVARCGNAVPPPFAEALVRANLPELCDGYSEVTNERAV